MLRTATVGPRYGVSWLDALYLIAGGIVAATVASALLATVAWPLLLVGVNLHIH